MNLKKMGVKCLVAAFACFGLVGVTHTVAHAAVGTSIPDLSEWQGAFTATQVKNLKKTVPFVILRVQYGSDYKDKDFAHNVALCKEYGLKYGVYSFSQYSSTSDAKTEANDLYTRAPSASFYVNDYEDQTVTSGTTNSATAAWYSELRAKAPHRRILFYSYQSFANEYAATAMKKYDGYWLAAYQSTEPSMSHVLWQYTDDWYASAIAENVDASKKHSKDTSWFLSSRAISYNKTVTASKAGYTIWGSLGFSNQKGTTKKGTDYTAKYYYDHYNGRTYYSLYNKSGKWVGYVNKNAMKTMTAKADGATVTLKKGGYNIWNSLMFTKANRTTTALKGRSYTAKYYYTAGNGTVYYSLYDGNTWIGYVNANATK
ncbi:GH25 family lysozyme [Secundilactobacillus folii]|uniref:Lysozyme domain-containing protein n=1 Tax=Secundilactobacillus folii TaxID=2678357 RepID=A0A7X2XU75_9LACO|nr:GH25 family lysozyme [Secundilactobacillus folii]MTV81772.1 hypothetical protein [Secundilactobacillus folii]